MRKFTLDNLKRVIQEINIRYEFDDTSPCKLRLAIAYGCYQVVIQQNKPYGFSAMGLTSGHSSLEGCLDELITKNFDRRLNADIYEFLIKTLSIYHHRRRNGFYGE